MVVVVVVLSIRTLPTWTSKDNWKEKEGDGLEGQERERGRERKRERDDHFTVKCQVQT